MMFSIVAFSAFVLTQSAEPVIDAVKAELDTFKKYLAEKHSGKKWQQGPMRIDSESIRKAYGENVRFYYTFSAPPLPPGAPLPDLIKRHQEAVEDIRKNHISVTVMIDREKKITPLIKPEDYSQGLIAIKTDDDVRVAGAAILSLAGQDRVGPGAVEAKEVTITKNEKGWTCSAMTRFMQGSVQFDSKGKCTSVSKVYAGPLPPSAPPKFVKDPQ